MMSTIEILLAAGEHRGWWPLWLVFWLAVGATVVWLVARRRGPGGPSGPSGTDRARDILAERFARGDMTADEYRERLAEL